jgi:hypothetical protein
MAVDIIPMLRNRNLSQKVLKQTRDPDFFLPSIFRAVYHLLLFDISRLKVLTVESSRSSERVKPPYFGLIYHSFLSPPVRKKPPRTY